MPVIDARWRHRLYSVIQEECTRCGAAMIAIGGIEDHVHVLVRLPTTISISDLVKRLKGASSHFVNHAVRPDLTFRWQGGYGAFTLSRSAVEKASAYIANQEAHHRTGHLNSALEATESE
jgi:REP element-mobilizing transposase RayT